ncbi:MAG: leucine-rich repeat protein [Firmicutes bacterium]|nr:leucine-rich repeat protein [Bacillota bacterium]
MKKRLLTFCLAIALILVSVPANIFAADIVDSGSCGDNLTWTLDRNGTLTISGSGAMWDYQRAGGPWRTGDNPQPDVTALILPNGLTSIGTFAFRDCVFTSVTLPESVESIGELAFWDCEKLVSINLPKNLRRIGDDAFSGCQSLQSIHIPAASLGSGIFAHCYALSNVTIADGATAIPPSMFAYCSSLTSLVIPSGVTSIGAGAFDYCTSLTSLVIPDSVTTIENAFAKCSGLANKDGLIIMNGRLFSFCENKDASPKDPETLVDIIIPEGVKTIEKGAFQWCGSVRSIRIPEGVTMIGNGAFYCCGALESITIPDSVKQLGPGDDDLSDMFYMCESLKSIKVGSGNSGYKDIDGVLFNKAGTELLVCPAGRTGEYIIPGGVTKIAPNAFFDSKVTSIVIPEGVTVLDGISWCYSLKSITIPRSVTKIEEFGIYNCEYLDDIYYCGTAADWNAIEKGDTDPDLSKVKIHFNTAPVDPNAVENIFKDVPAGAWYAKFLQKAYDSKIIAGTSATTYAPTANLNHGQIMVMAANLHSRQKQDKYDFQANKKAGDAWYQVFEDYCKAEGIIDGRFDGAETRNVTREEMAYYFANTLTDSSYKNKKTVELNDIAGNPYEEEIVKLAKADIVGGKGEGKYDPSGLITRAEAAVFISNILDAIE